jgi:secondary thiamine-phosphate synthase enzyme
MHIGHHTMGDPTGDADGHPNTVLPAQSASLLIQENADPKVRFDLTAYFDRIAPENGPYEHDSERPDDMPAHLKTALTQVQISIPLVNGKLALGTWQGIYVFEHRARPHRRQVILHLIGA